MKTAIHWFRRDLRLNDNTALYLARKEAETVIPVFCWDEDFLKRPDVGHPRVWFLFESLKRLQRRISEHGGRLLVLRGCPEEQIPKIARQTGAEAVYFNRDYEPYARKRDESVSKRLVELGVKACPQADLLLVEPDDALTAEGKPYSVFTPFWKKWELVPKADPLPEISDFGNTHLHPLPEVPVEAPQISLPAEFDTEAWTPGEQAALIRLETFRQDILEGYSENRDIPSVDGTSRLSPYLKFGNVSMRTVLQATSSAIKFVQELCWREFYFHVMYHWPEIENQAWQPDKRKLEWDDAPELLEAWKYGRTGYPIVDAGMRQLLKQGWMHNRVRMIVASFLTKDLHINWQEGERWFMLRLVDGDLAPNNGGWQWAASTGVDPRPLRIFNPYLQSQRFDADGDYIRRWVPELQNLPADKIHNPQLMTPDEQSRLGCLIGRDYPAPIVDHSIERAIALRRYQDAKSGQGKLL